MPLPPFEVIRPSSVNTPLTFIRSAPPELAYCPKELPPRLPMVVGVEIEPNVDEPPKAPAPAPPRPPQLPPAEPEGELLATLPTAVLSRVSRPPPPMFALETVSVHPEKPGVNMELLDIMRLLATTELNEPAS